MNQTSAKGHSVATEKMRINWWRVLYRALGVVPHVLAAAGVAGLIVWQAQAWLHPCQISMKQLCVNGSFGVELARTLGVTIALWLSVALAVFAVGCVAEHGPRHWSALKRRAGVE